MEKLYLLDTCIWRDFYENRISKQGKDFGSDAAKLFIKIIMEKGKILFSEILVEDLRRCYSEKEIIEMLGLLELNKVLVKTAISKEEHIEAKKLSKERKLPFTDCLNAVLARTNDALLVSQDRHFEKLKDIARTARPKEII